MTRERSSLVDSGALESSAPRQKSAQRGRLFVSLSLLPGHRIGTVNCANQTRLPNSKEKQELGRRVRLMRRGRESLTAGLLLISECGNFNHFNMLRSHVKPPTLTRLGIDAIPNATKLPQTFGRHCRRWTPILFWNAETPTLQATDSPAPTVAKCTRSLWPLQRNGQIGIGGLDSLRIMKMHHDDAPRNRCRDPHLDDGIMWIST